MEFLKQGVNLEQDDDAAGFLGVTLGQDEATGFMEMKQVGLLDSVIETLGLDYGMENIESSPYESKPLVNDSDGSAPCGTFSYSRVVGMLLYLSGHTRPYIFYALN